MVNRFSTLAMAAVFMFSGQVASSAPPSKYQFNFANFFPSPTAEESGRSEVMMAMADLERKSDQMDTGAQVLDALKADDRAQRLFRRHDLYLFLRYAVDTRQEEGLSAAEEMRTRLRGARNKLKLAAVGKGEKWFEEHARTVHGLASYRYWFRQASRESQHLLPKSKQEVVDALEPLLSGQSYPTLVQGLKFEPVVVDGKKLDPVRDRAALEGSGSAAIRAAAEANRNAGYRARRDQFSDLLIRTIRGENAIAKLHLHDDALAQASFNAAVTPEQYRNLLSTVASRAGVTRRRQSLNRDPFIQPFRMSVRDAVAAIVGSTGTFGSRYSGEFRDLLDPDKGRADFSGPGPRLPLQGAASVYPIGISTIYMADFQGDLLDLIILAHESGHAVQAQLMANAGVPMVYAAGPGYFTESFGRFQELVLLDHLFRTAPDRSRRELMRDALAARLLSVFNSAEEAAIELNIHDEVMSGKAKNADDLDSITRRTFAAYSGGTPSDATSDAQWMMSGGYYLSPYQELNDAFASLLAIRYFAMYRSDRRSFVKSYLALLSSGYRDAPGQLLKKHLGIDMPAAHFAATTLDALDREVLDLYLPSRIPHK